MPLSTLICTPQSWTHIEIRRNTWMLPLYFTGGIHFVLTEFIYFQIAFNNSSIGLFKKYYLNIFYNKYRNGTKRTRIMAYAIFFFVGNSLAA